MYCLKVEKLGNNVNNENKIFDSTIFSFENFRNLYVKKLRFDRKGNQDFKYRTSIYKISNEGLSIELLSDMKLYEEIKNIQNELKSSNTNYSFIRKVLKGSRRAYSIKGNVLIIHPKSLKLEIEMVRTTPKYEIRRNGKLLFEETSQVDIVDRLKNEYGIDLYKKSENIKKIDL